MGRARASEVVVEEGAWRLVLVGALVLVACDPPAPAPVTATTKEVAPIGFTPTTVGDAWTYQTSQATPGLAMPGATSTDRIVAGGPEGERWVGRIVSEDANNPAASSERALIVTPAGLSPDIGAMATAMGPVTTVQASGVFLPTELTPGLRWTWTQTIDSPVSTMQVAGSGEVIGAESVTVPAGTFAAIKVRSETRNHMIGKLGAIPAVDHVQRDESWYVRGLGLVKNVTRLDSGYRADKVLLRYSVHGAPFGQAQVAAP